MFSKVIYLIVRRWESVFVFVFGFFVRDIDLDGEDRIFNCIYREIGWGFYSRWFGV